MNEKKYIVEMTEWEMICIDQLLYGPYSNTNSESVLIKEERVYRHECLKSVIADMLEIRTRIDEEKHRV